MFQVVKQFKQNKALPFVLVGFLIL